MTDAPAIGIDLGTTNTCVAVWSNGKAEILKIREKDMIIPSCVAFCQEGLLIGKNASMQSPGNPVNTIFDAKRIIGVNSDCLANFMKYWPLNFAQDDANNPMYVVELMNEKKAFYPEQILALILVKVKKGN